jgi:hypothetical protein
MSPTWYVVLMLAGFAIGAYGHLVRSRATIATGIAVIFAVAVLMPLFRVGG